MGGKSRWAGVCLAAVGLLCTVSAPAQARVLSDEQIAAMSPQQQAVLLDPLRATASALGAAGRGELADVYGNLAIDANHGVVRLYLTDTAQTGRAFAAARAVDPGLDTSRVQVVKAAYTHRELDAASQHLLDLAEANRLPYQVYLAGPAPDASGLEVTVGASKPVAAQASLELPVNLVPGRPLVPKAWADVKWNDTAPFIGGDAITSSGSGVGCTAGLPAVRKSDNHPIMVTAAHCFGVGTQVYTRAGRAGDYNNGQRGNSVGKVTARYEQFDSETIDGADNNADESDTDGWKPLSSYAYSYNGDYVCHAGQRSFFMGHPTPCNIKVTNQDKWCSATEGCPGLGYRVRGVWGDAVNRGWGAAGGDSGATIFAVQAGDKRQARGVLSDGDAGDGAPGVFWTEATDVFDHFGLTLNPRT
ncbi:hypothetical protein GCM10010174_69230 [Kutzneria viridogrisea]|uniref:Uncharacterized protein n=1 Tax=Kutzneria viridogrisea TaxID=47990 RepID=A0ABR6BB24_9PSEU|nr:hypothetical protein [Kutzneria viridogrisea]